MRAQTGTVKFFNLDHGDCVALGDEQHLVKCLIEVTTLAPDQYGLIVYGLPPNPDLPFEAAAQGRVGLEQGPVMIGPYKTQCHHVDEKKPLRVYYDGIPYAGSAWHGTPAILDDNIQFIIECREGERFGMCTVAITHRDSEKLSLEVKFLPGGNDVHFDLHDTTTWSSKDKDVGLQFYGAKDSDGRMHLFVIGARNNHVSLLGKKIATGETMVDKQALGTAPTMMPMATPTASD